MLNVRSGGGKNEFNKKFGVYYTPQEIVHYMCKQSLIHYLHTKSIEAGLLSDIKKRDLEDLIEVGEFIAKDEETVLAEEGKIKNEIQKTSAYTPILSDSIRKNAKILDGWLKNITVCDPAVGSGAFPLGMMHEIVRARRVLSVYLSGGARSEYEFKRHCIKYSLHGVDIDPGAVEVSKLRLWLSLMADGGDQKNIKPPSKLGYKIVCGNSLLDMEKGLFNEVFHRATPQSGTVGQAGGFDVVIGNPPYIGERGNKKIFEPIKISNLGKRFYQGKMDILYFFFHLALDVLKKKGIASFITTNYFITATGATRLRNDLKERATILKMVNFGEFKIFDSVAGHNMIMIFKKGREPLGPVEVAKVMRKGYLKNNGEIISRILSGSDENTDYFTQSNETIYYGRNNYIGFWPKELSHIFDKMIKDSQPLGKICAVNQGIITGADKVGNSHLRKYNWDSKEGDAIYIVHNKEVKLFPDKSCLYEWFKNSDITRYNTQSKSKENVLYINSSFDKDEYVLKHLGKFKENLESRREVQKGSREWYELWWPREQRIFDSPKIVAPQRLSRVIIFPTQGNQKSHPLPVF